MSKITIFTDGSSLGNPGRGGFGTIVLFHDQKMVFELGGREDTTTNNRMELRAVIAGLKHISNIESVRISVYLDSNYVLNGITKWVYGWEKNNWTTAAKEKVLNQDLWQELLTIKRNIEQKNKIEWIYVRGHAGIPGNERVDEIATNLAEGESVNMFSGSFSEYEIFLNCSIGMLHIPKWEISEKKKGDRRKAFSYVSKVGDEVSVDKNWDECEKKVRGKAGAKYKKVFTKEEEIELVNTWKN